MTSNFRFGRRVLLVLVFSICVSLPVSFAQTQYKVYAGLIYHFVKYTQWPAASSEVVLGVMGKTAMNSEVLALNGKMAGAMKITIKEIHSVAEASGCQVLFVPAEYSTKYHELVPVAKQNHILLVSNSTHAIRDGVVINFYEEESKVKFEISNKHASSYGLKISADLQKLAKVVD